MINWGDGNSSAGTISGSGGSFNVTGSHTYAAVGTYPISVTITSVGASLGRATVADSATVAPPTAPVVTGLSPSSGPTAGGTSVTITGNNLTGATAVKFGPNGATNVHVVNSGQITATSGAGKGLVTLAIVEAAFNGAPSYSLCTKHEAADPSANASSVKTLQLLHASAKGKFRTKGRYSAATVLGTKWTVADRCDGTLTHDITDSVSVADFVRHKTIILHAGQSYLAKAALKAK